MSADQTIASECVIGHLQKKSRFYGWKKALFVLCEQGLIQLSNDQQQTQPNSDAACSIASPSLVIGDIGGVDPCVAVKLKQKQSIALHQIGQVIGQGQRDISITLLTSASILLRAQSTDDRELWLAAVRSAVAAAAIAGYTTGTPACDQETPVTVHQTLELPDTTPPPTFVEVFASSAATPRITGWSLSANSAQNQFSGLGDDIATSPINLFTEGNNQMSWLPSAASLRDLNPEQSAANAISSISFTQNFEENAAHQDQDADSFDADAFFDDNESMDAGIAANGSTSSGELPLAMVAQKTAELRQQEQSTAFTFLRKSVAQLPDLGTAEALVNVTKESEFSGIFDMFLPQQADKNFNYTLPSAAAEETIETLPVLQPAATRTSHDQNTTQKDTSFSKSCYFEATAKPPLDNYSGAHKNNTATSAKQLIVNAKEDMNINESSVVLNTSIADFAGALFDGLGSGDLAAMLADTRNINEQEQEHEQGQDELTNSNVNKSLARQSVDYFQNQTVPSQSSFLADPNRPAQGSSANLLNSPGRQRLGSQNRTAIRHSVVTVCGGLNADTYQQQYDSSSLVGIQTKLLEKYSNSLCASRALLVAGSRGNKTAAAHGWNPNIGKANGRGIYSQRPATIVQYAPAEPKNKGISRVVPGQLAKELIQKEAERRPAVRRIRQVKSETKVLPLKAIRLKLDGSIVGGNGKNAGLAVQQNLSQASFGRGLRYMAKDGQTAGIGSQDISSPQASKSIIADASRMTDGATNGNFSKRAATDHNANVYNEFSEIRERLKLAEEQKKLQQHAQILDKEGVDNVRIAAILETRKDVPLAVQLEERRQMQAAKQIALLNQQLEHQKMQLELQRLNSEQQYQHQQFKRQSLCPTNSRLAMPLSSASFAHNGWPGHESNACGGCDNYTSQWVQSQDFHNYSAVPSPYSQSASMQHQAFPQCQPASRPVSSIGFRPTAYQNPIAGGYTHRMSTANMPSSATPVVAYDTNQYWQQQQQLQYQQQFQQNTASRPLSQYTQSAATGPQPSAVSVENSTGRSLSTSARRQPGAAFVKHARAVSTGAKSDHSDASTESWQSNVGHSAGVSVHTTTEPVYEGSIYVISPVLGTSADASADPRAAAKRASSYGQAEHRRRRQLANGNQPALFRPRTMSIADNAPPVPPLPTTLPPRGNPMALCSQIQQPQHQQQQQMDISSLLAQNSMRMSNKQRILADMQKISKKRTEMSTETPSLLQRLEQAQVSGVLPGRHHEKTAYTKGGYQNFDTTRVARDGSSAQYLGDGNTLLIDQVYESEKSRAAFLKKISHTYTGIGRQAAPNTVFLH
ncbi:hypothetical protein GGI26_002904 [Coemansia sp. RSA 1358]|uniref:PH domain-containing protein n=1 Tax=Coemansia umbellata TaxID=1424467 RepID=A0ABQ8PNN8_9FUNG|nr:hypothetical protein EDC05_002494 [Coemansia umbellata]KAJ2622797.1 hypothetical protein GGI26_002904 [Coemansia sp. RSA 1358]